MALINDSVCFARDENNDLIIPLRKASGLEAVLIMARTILLLHRDEYFLNRDIGTPWLPTEDGVVAERDAILGEGYDAGKTLRALRPQLMAIPNVRDVAEFKSAFEGGDERSLSVSMVLRTRFGDAPLAVTIPA